jgi:hypothetical protein
MRKIKKSVSDFINVILWDIHYVSIEVFNSVSLIGFGISILLTPASQKIIRDSLPDSVVSNFSPLVLVSYVMIFVGIVQMFALRYSSIKIRKWITFFSIFFWGFLLVIFTEPPYKPTAICFIVELTAFNLWSFIRLVLKHRSQRLLDPRDPYGNN